MAKKFQIGYTYSLILDSLFKLKTVKSKNIQQTIGANSIQFTSVGESDRVPQGFIVTERNLASISTPAEWHMLGLIGTELKYGNSLWYCKPEHKSSSSQRAVLALLKTEKKDAEGNLMRFPVLIPTETTDIFMVNPIYIRRGDILFVLAATAETIMDSPKVRLEHIKDNYRTKGESLTPANTTLDKMSNPVLGSVRLQNKPKSTTTKESENPWSPPLTLQQEHEEEKGFD